MRAGYTETKFVGNYIYNIVTNKKREPRILGQGIRTLEKKAAANLNFLDNPRAM